MTDADLGSSRDEREALLDRRFELAESIIIAIAAVLTAWTAFQSTKWGGVQADFYSRAGATRTESVRASGVADRQATIDVTVFTEWLAARADELRQDPNSSLGRDGIYTPDPGTLSGFLFLRFRPEFRAASAAWLDLRPLQSADAPQTPFDMPQYRLASAEEAANLEVRAEELADSARAANQRGDNYVLVTILYALVLFFAGISSKMDTARARGFLLGVAIVVLVGTTIVVATMPIKV